MGSMARLDELPPDLVEPIDDGAANHLPGRLMPPLALPSTHGASMRVDLAPTGANRLVLYAYPRTGRPDQELPAGWDLIPGARGCTPQARSFRDHAAELAELGAAVAGVSTQDTAYQAEAAQRLHLPFPLLSDDAGELTTALGLPTFEAAGMRLLKRLTLIVCDGRIEHVFYPVFPPDQHPTAVLSWLANH
jgi:peroxiredoxin